MNVAVIAFTGQGCRLGYETVCALEERGIRAGLCYKGRCAGHIPARKIESSLTKEVGRLFGRSDGLLFIGAAGIAVRAVAPYLQDKMTDPFVLVMDEKGGYIISLLSGHMGGGNEMARIIGEAVGAQPVITTATDVNGRFAVDLFAKDQKLFITDRTMAKAVSSAILDGEPVGFFCELPVQGSYPAGLIPFGEEEERPGTGIAVSIREAVSPYCRTLRLVPRILTAGLGCRKNISFDKLEAFVLETMEEQGLSMAALKQIASIDIKKEEPALLEFAGKYKIPFVVFSAEELNRVPGVFSESDFVRRTTGTGSVCERAAMAAGTKSLLTVRKRQKDGMTIAIAIEERGVYFE